MNKFTTTAYLATVMFAIAWQCPAGAVEAKITAGNAAASQSPTKSADTEEIVSMPASSAINPMTGRSTRYEELEMVLREKTVQAKIAEQDFALAKSRADTKKLAGERQPDAFSVARIPEEVRAQAQKSAPKKLAVSKRAAPIAKVDAPPVVPAYRAPERPRLLGVADSGGEKLAVVAFDGRTQMIKEGATVGGMTVGSITKTSALINGVQVGVEKGVSTINLPDTHQVVVPGATLGQAASQPVRGVVVQGVNTAAVQPMAPGSSIPANTQPTRFPNDLYNR